MAESTKIIRDKAISAPIGHVKMVSSLPQTPEDYYGSSHSMQDDEWRGGEIVYVKGTSTGSNKLYIQTAESGRTPTWKTVATGFTTP